MITKRTLDEIKEKNNLSKKKKDSTKKKTEIHDGRQTASLTTVFQQRENFTRSQQRIDFIR